MERIRVYLMSIKFTDNEMLEMEEIISSFFENKDIKLTIPVDIFKVASDLGFDVRGTEFREPLEGILLVNEHVEEIAPFESNKVIAYNCQKDISSKKFIVAHELAHYIMAKNKSKDSKVVVAARDHEQSYSEDVDEQRMDYIAASLLVPRDDLIDRFYNNRQQEGLCEKVASIYNVADELAARRIEEILK